MTSLDSGGLESVGPLARGGCAVTDGFLGTRASATLDLVVVALAVGLPLLMASIWLVRYPKFYRWHQRLQTTIGSMLFLTIVAFEMDVRFFGWRDRAAASSYWMSGPANDWVDYSLWMHLAFAIPTPFLWAGVLWAAWREISVSPLPPRAQPEPPPLGLCCRSCPVDDRRDRMAVLLVGLCSLTDGVLSRSRTSTPSAACVSADGRFLWRNAVR